MLIPGSQLATAQTLIQRYIQQFVGNKTIVTVNPPLWQSNIYTVTGTTNYPQSIPNLFPSSIQYQELLLALQGTDNAIVPPNPSPPVSYGMPVGISIGGVILIGIVLAGLYFVFRRRYRGRVMKHKSAPKKYTKPLVFGTTDKDVVMTRNKYIDAVHSVQSSPVLETRPKQRNEFSPLAISGASLSARKLPLYVPPLNIPPPPSLEFYTAPSTRRLTLHDSNTDASRTTFAPSTRILMARKPSISDVTRQHPRLPLSLANPSLVERERSQSETHKWSRLPSMTKIATSARNVYHPTMNAKVLDAPTVIHVDVPSTPKPMPAIQEQNQDQEKRLQFTPQKSNRIANIIRKFDSTKELNDKI